ncbi:MAG: type I-C CRISPR-associated protein Cas8c/Csd1 [Methylotenera sp.]|nr:type I-C CRISPR-associated protein Cas8c/Csd1 [Methylotenera sp.]
MILTALAQYYQRLLANPDKDSGLPRVPSYGFSEEKIGYILVLSQDGALVDVQNNMDTSGKKPMPKLTSVPRPEKRTSGIKSNFLWDKTAYVLGVEGNKDKGSVKEVPWIVAQKTFEAFKQLHIEKLADMDDAGLKALSLFLQNWQPEQFNQAPFSPEMIDANVVFKLDGDYQLLHDRVTAKLLWSKMLTPEEGALESGCLVTGEMAPIARLHPAIKGVYGGQSSGGSIVSFNADAYTSYGKSQGENAPVSEAAAFAYTTALNYLLRRENGQCISIGDASTVFWAVASDENTAHEAESLFGWMMNMPADDGQETAQIKPVLEKIAQGRPLKEFAPNIAESTRFYVLGLAPNASRLSIRYWMDTTFEKLAENNSKHWLDLQLNPSAWQSKPPSVWQLLIQTTPKRKDQDGRLKKSDSKDIPSQLAGEFMRAVLTGQPYPVSLLAKLISRIRADGYLNGLRVAMIKAVLNRNSIDQKEIPVGLDKDEIDKAYRLGRLFAVLEVAQSAALGNLNANIRDRYYGGASSTPNSIFPLLLKNYRNHHAGLRKGKKAEWVKDAAMTAGWLEKEVSQIMQVFNPNQPFPRTMNLAEQGRFVVGYYHQKFTKQSDAPDDVKQIAESDVSENQNEENLGE